MKLRREVFMKARGAPGGQGKIATAQAVASMLPGKTRKT